MALNIPPGTPVGDYRLELSLYDPASGAPIPANVNAARGAVVLARVRLDDTMAVLSAER
jgi:hypothetical protein